MAGRHGQREQTLRRPQRQRRQPGIESKMRPRPVAEDPGYRGCGKLRGRVALITGGDSGIGRAVAIAFAKEEADVAIVYYNEHGDAKETVRQVESEALVEKGIRVNGVAPGPIWTPLIPSTFRARDVATFGSDVPMKRAGEPEEVAPSYVFLASDDASYMTGQFLHPNGGEIVNT